MGRKILRWVGVTVITLILLEVTLLIAARLNLVAIALPTYSISNARPFSEDIDPDVGAWHVPLRVHRHIQQCFDVVYQANSHGMRDKESELRSASPRVVVLGDSFSEGVGVAYGGRFSDRLETLTGIEHLDFGMSGFGSTREMVMYEKIASKFDHDAVILAVLPANDFVDDTPSPGRLAKGARHRPYLVGSYSDYALSYPEGGFVPNSLQRRFWLNLPAEFSIVAQALSYAVAAVDMALENLGGAQSYYFDFKPEHFDRLRYAIERIKKQAGERPLLVMTIPIARDYLRARSEAGDAPLTRAMTELAARVGFTYVDMLTETARADWRPYFLSCNSHWSEAGHDAAAGALGKWDVYEKLRQQQ